MSAVEPAYQIPSHKQMMQVLHQIQAEAKEKLKKELTETEWVAITSDFWTSSAVDLYMSILSCSFSFHIMTVLTSDGLECFLNCL